MTLHYWLIAQTQGRVLASTHTVKLRCVIKLFRTFNRSTFKFLKFELDQGSINILVRISAAQKLKKKKNASGNQFSPKLLNQINKV